MEGFVKTTYNSKLNKETTKGKFLIHKYFLPTCGQGGVRPGAVDSAVAEEILADAVAAVGALHVRGVPGTAALLK